MDAGFARRLTAAAAAVVLATSVCRSVALAGALDAVAQPDSYAATIGTALSVAAPGVLRNDSSPLGLGLGMTAELHFLPANGTLTLRADGSLRYVPATGVSGTAVFEYRAVYLLTHSNWVKVTITVSPPSTPKPTPTAPPTPTPTPSPTPTPRPTPTPTAAPTRTPSRTVRPTPTLPLATVPIPSLIPSLPLPSVPVASLPTPTLVAPPVASPTPTATPDPTQRPSPASSGSVLPSASTTVALAPVAVVTSSAGPPSGGGIPASPPDPTAADAASGRSRAATEPFDVAGLARSGSMTVDVSLGSFDDLGVWFVPAAVLGVPGLLILLVLSIQILGGAMWLPLIRSSLRGVGVGDS